jgi:hypothetical protein
MIDATRQRPALSLSLVALFALWAFVACRKPAMRVDWVPVYHSGEIRVFKDVSALEQEVVARNFGYRTLKTVHQVSLDLRAGDAPTAPRALTGVLALRRPDRFRLTVLGPMGAKLLDVIYVAGRTQLVATSATHQRHVDLSRLVPTFVADIAQIYRLGAPRSVARRVMEESLSLAGSTVPLTSIKDYDAEGKLMRETMVYATSLAISRVEWTEANGDTKSIVCGDHRNYRGHLQPSTIVLTSEGKSNYGLTIRVQALELDGPLHPRLFLEAAPNAS